MKVLVGAFNQEKALVGAFSVIVQPVVEPMDRFAALKASSRGGVQYVGPVTSPAVWRYYLCLHLETTLAALADLDPGLAPAWLWDVCSR